MPVLFDSTQDAELLGRFVTHRKDEFFDFLESETDWEEDELVQMCDHIIDGFGSQTSALDGVTGGLIYVTDEEDGSTNIICQFYPSIRMDGEMTDAQALTAHLFGKLKDLSGREPEEA